MLTHLYHEIRFFAIWIWIWMSYNTWDKNHLFFLSSPPISTKSSGIIDNLKPHKSMVRHFAFAIWIWIWTWFFLHKYGQQHENPILFSVSLPISTKLSEIIQGLDVHTSVERNCNFVIWIWVPFSFILTQTSLVLPLFSYDFHQTFKDYKGSKCSHIYIMKTVFRNLNQQL